MHFQSLLPGVEAASHDEDFRVQLSALTYLHEFGSESKLFRERLDQALNKRESLDTIRFMMQTVRNDKEWDEWRIRAVAQFFERTQLAMAKDDPANADLLILVVTLIDLGKSEEAAAPLVPALTRIIESDLKWIDRTDLTEEHGQAAKTLHSPLKWRNGPVLGLPLSAPKSIRAAVVLTLGAIGKQAEPALPAIRKLKTSQEQHLREAAIIAEKAITAKPAETTKAPATGSTGPSKVSPTKTTAP